MSIEVNNETTYQVEEAEFVDLLNFCLAQLNVSAEADVNLLFIESAPMAELHERWLDLPGPTDVMSFPMDELRPGTPDSPTTAGVLGDIVICPEVAAGQAMEQGHSSVEEMLMLTVHGLLHLLGYDHAEPDEAAAMFTLQRHLLLTYLAERK